MLEYGYFTSCFNFIVSYKKLKNWELFPTISSLIIAKASTFLISVEALVCLLGAVEEKNEGFL